VLRKLPYAPANNVSEIPASTDNWCVDSGGFSHITNDFDDFEGYEAVELAALLAIIARARALPLQNHSTTNYQGSQYHTSRLYRRSLRCSARLKDHL
jgi:hypothetical protein